MRVKIIKELQGDKYNQFRFFVGQEVIVNRGLCKLLISDGFAEIIDNTWGEVFDFEEEE